MSSNYERIFSDLYPGANIANHKEFNEVLSFHLKSLIATTKEMGLEVPPDLSIGEIPSPEFNACACLDHTSSPIILINSSLPRLLMMSANLIAGIAPILFQGKIVPAQISEQDGKRFLIGMIDAYIDGTNQFEGFMLPSVGQSLACVLFENSMEFVVCHELGHIVNGHLDNAKFVRALDAEFDFRAAYFNWSNEIEADTTALRITQQSNDGRSDHALAGAALLFELCSTIVWRMRERGFSVPILVSSHPPASGRYSAACLATGFREGKSHVPSSIIAGFELLRGESIDPKVAEPVLDRFHSRISTTDLEQLSSKFAAVEKSHNRGISMIDMDALASIMNDRISAQNAIAFHVLAFHSSPYEYRAVIEMMLSLCLSTYCRQYSADDEFMQEVKVTLPRYAELIVFGDTNLGAL